MPHSAHPARRTPALLIVGAVAGVAALTVTMLAVPAATAAPTHRSASTSVTSGTGASVGGTVRLGRRERAHRALANAQRALSPATPAAQRPDATMALRRLVLLKDALPAQERLAAEKLAGRPVKTNAIESGNIRIHWTPAEMAASSFTANTVLNTAVHVSQTYSGAGYRKPLKDGNRGGNSKTDVYVDVLPPGLYGYCTTDDNSIGQGGKYDTWAYCVVDNDYAGFPLNTPLENLQVTMAHEYFHATQFAYDIAEDGWFMEGTAVWAEDEVYDAVDDNVQYLADSPITKPSKSMDKFGGLYHYGTWIWFRYLTEKFKQSNGGLPTLILDTWKAADSSKGPKKDKYSVEAIAKVLQGRKFPMDKAFSLFSDVNRRARKAYNEGNANHYPNKKLEAKKRLTSKGQSKRFTSKLNHLSSATYQFDSKSLGSKFELKLAFNLAPKASGSRAVVTTYKTSGKARSKYVKLNSQGNKTLEVAFGSSAVKYVEVTIVNASIQMNKCYQQPTAFACSGKPDDQNVRGWVRGTVVK
jgi:hypothetical protein